MVKLKYNPLEDGLQNQSVTNFFKALKGTTTNKNEGKGPENGETIEFSKKITNDDTNDKDNKINQTEEATESPKANTETTDKMDERADARAADNPTAEIGDETDDENKNKNKKQNKNNNNDNHETQLNKSTEKMMSTEENNEATKNKSGLLQHVNRFHEKGAADARRSEEEEKEEKKRTQSTKEVLAVTADNIDIIKDGWDGEEDEYVSSEDETEGKNEKNTEVATGAVDEDTKNTNTKDKGATECNSTSTIGDDGVGNKDSEDSLSLEERETMEGSATEMKVAATSNGCEEFSVMAEKNTKASGDPPAQFHGQNMEQE